jgi:hypothetical protein
MTSMACLACVQTARADVPTWSTIELQCRSNFTVNGGGFNLPGDSFFSNATPAINDAREVAVRISIVAGGNTQGMWFGQGGTGQIEYTGPADASVSDPSLNDAGYVVVEQSFTAADGLIFYNGANDTSGFITDQPIGASGWGSATVNNSGNIGYRASFLGDNALYIWNGISATLVAAEVDLVGSSPYSFIFTPTFDDADRIAVKVRYGGPGQFGDGQPDEIRLFSINGTSTLLAEDVDANPVSPFDGFDNSCALTNDGRVAFVANLVGGGRGVFLSDGSSATTIATTGDPNVNSIESFSPTVNEAGLVAFRGFDGSGLRAIFAGDGTTLVTVVREHDLLATDLGTARIDQNDSSPVFGGSIRLNNLGDLAFHCTLTPENNNQVEWGSGIFVALADPPVIACPADCAPDNGDGTFGNGVVNIDDLLAVINAFGQLGGPCDIAPDNGDGTFGNGIVNIDDLLGVINAFGPCAAP